MVHIELQQVEHLVRQERDRAVELPVVAIEAECQRRVGLVTCCERAVLQRAGGGILDMVASVTFFALTLKCETSEVELSSN